MTEQDDFLQAIVEAPDDDTPRLIYADWLEEHGESERGEFIRLQCELARLSKCSGPGIDIYSGSTKPYWVGTSDCGRCHWCQLKKREQELLWVSIDKPDWFFLCRLLEITPTISWKFHRGFIEQVECTCQQWLDHGAEVLRACPTIREVRFSDFQLNSHVPWAGATRRWTWELPHQWQTCPPLPLRIFDGIIARMESEAEAYAYFSRFAILYAREQMVMAK